MLPLRLCRRARLPARWYLRVFDLSYVYRAIGCCCSRLHEPAGCLQSLVAHWPFDVSTWAFIGVSRSSPPEMASLDPIGMIMSPSGITFLGPVGVFSMSPPNFNYNWSRLEYHGDSNFLLCILCICIVSSSFYELCHSPCYAYYASE